MKAGGSFIIRLLSLLNSGWPDFLTCPRYYKNQYIIYSDSFQHLSYLLLILGAFAEQFWKETMSFFCQFVRSHGTARLPLPGFSWNFLLRIFTEGCRYSRSVKIGQKSRYFTQGTLYIYVIGVWNGDRPYSLGSMSWSRRNSWLSNHKNSSW
jgi:hypothetical protein